MDINKRELELSDLEKVTGGEEIPAVTDAAEEAMNEIRTQALHLKRCGHDKEEVIRTLLLQFPDGPDREEIIRIVNEIYWNKLRR